MNNLADRTTAELRAELDAMQARSLARIEHDRNRAAEHAGRNIGAERTAYALDRWAALAPLPNPLDIAGGIIAALRTLLDTFQDLGAALAWPVGNGAMHDEAAALLGTVDTVARIVRTWVTSVAIPDDDGAAQAADSLVRMLCSVQPVEHALYAEHYSFAGASCGEAQG